VQVARTHRRCVRNEGEPVILPITSTDVAVLGQQPPRIAATSQQSGSFESLLVNETERQANVKSQAPADSASRAGTGAASSAPSGGCMCGMSAPPPDPSAPGVSSNDGPAPAFTASIVSGLPRIGAAAPVESHPASRVDASPSGHRCADTSSAAPGLGILDSQSQLRTMNLNTQLLRQIDRSLFTAAVAGSRIGSSGFGAADDKPRD